MADHPNARLIEAMWDAISRSDVEALRHYWKDVVWHVRAPSPWAGDLVGADQIIDYLAQLGETAHEHSIRMRDLLANDDHAIVLSRVTTQRGQQRLDTDYVMLARIADHRIAEIWTMPLDPTAVSEFWHGYDVHFAGELADVLPLERK